MATLRDQAKIYVNDRLMRIDEGEPLEDSVRTVHAVMKMMAVRGGTPTTHNGVRGLKHHLNLTRVVTLLTIDYGENDRKVLARLISQVFRQTGAAVCLRHADPTNRKDPVWFVAEELPENFIVVVQTVRGRSAGASGRAPTSFDEKLFLRPGEKRLLPEEVGENQPPGEVTVTQTATQPKKGRRLNLNDEQRAAAAENARRVFGDNHAENQRIHRELAEQLHEFVVTAPVPMSSPEIAVLFNREFGTEWHESTMRGVLRELEQAGRIASRKETRAERLVRGGGQPVKATGPKLFGPPEGVPERTKLPRGIKPMKSAAVHAEEKKRLHLSLDDRVYKAMDVPNQPGTGHGAPRTPHMIAIAADLSDREALESLERMVANGRVFHHPTVGYYAPMTRVRQSTIEKYLKQPTLPGTVDDVAAAEVAPAVKAAEVPPAKPAVDMPADVREVVDQLRADVAREDIAALVRAEVERALGGGTPDVPGTDQANAELRSRNTELEAENTELRQQLARAEQAVAGLRSALAALG